MQKYTLRLVSSTVLEDNIPLALAATICLPAEDLIPPNPVALFCLAGGSMNQHYFDLQAEGDNSFSFAHAMAERGLITVTIDHPGIGNSDRPRDGFLLTPEIIAQADFEVAEKIFLGLRDGTLLEHLPPLRKLLSIGVGHSMGALITVIQNAANPWHQALVLLGFSDRGLPDYLPDPVKALIGAPEKTRSQLGEILRDVFPSAYLELPPSPEVKEIFQGGNADRAGVEAIKAARDILLVVPGMRSMIPGGVTADLARIQVPVFLGFGAKDIAGPPHEIPASLPNCPDMTLFVQKDAGHSHFIFPSRPDLFLRLANWSLNIAATAH